MIDIVAIKIARSPTELRGCFKIPSTKRISSYWYQHRRFGYISLVTFGSRWTPSVRSAAAATLPEGGGGRTDANYWQSDIEPGPIILESSLTFFVSFYILSPATFVPIFSIHDSVLPRFHVKILRIRDGRYAFCEKICCALHEFKSPTFGYRKRSGLLSFARRTPLFLRTSCVLTNFRIIVYYT